MTFTEQLLAQARVENAANAVPDSLLVRVMQYMRTGINAMGNGAIKHDHGEPCDDELMLAKQSFTEAILYLVADANAVKTTMQRGFNDAINRNLEN